MRILINAMILGCFFCNQAFAIEPVYEGDNGIRENVFAANCLFCHSISLTGSDRNGAPPTFNWDQFNSAKEKGDRIIARAVQQMSMPPKSSGYPTLNAEQKAALLAWQQGGFLRYPNNATYTFETLELVLPVVKVENVRFRAILKLIFDALSPTGFSFILTFAELTSDNSPTEANFNVRTGEVNLPAVDLLNNGVNEGKVSAVIKWAPGFSPLRFMLTKVMSVSG